MISSIPSRNNPPMNRLAAMETFVTCQRDRLLSGGKPHGTCSSGSPPFRRRSRSSRSRLGVQLLLRSTHRLTPTEAGQKLSSAPNSPSSVSDDAERIAPWRSYETIAAPRASARRSPFSRLQSCRTCRCFWRSIRVSRSTSCSKTETSI